MSSGEEDRQVCVHCGMTTWYEGYCVNPFCDYFRAEYDLAYWTNVDHEFIPDRVVAKRCIKCWGLKDNAVHKRGNHGTEQE